MIETLYNLIYRVIYLGTTNFKNDSLDEIVEGCVSYYLSIDDLDSANIILEADPSDVQKAYNKAVTDYDNYIESVGPIASYPQEFTESLVVAKLADKVFNEVKKYLVINTPSQGAKVYEKIHTHLTENKDLQKTVLTNKQKLVNVIMTVSRNTRVKIQTDLED